MGPTLVPYLSGACPRLYRSSAPAEAHAPPAPLYIALPLPLFRSALSTHFHSALMTIGQGVTKWLIVTGRLLLDYEGATADLQTLRLWDME
jgi:hypothetical protein